MISWHRVDDPKAPLGHALQTQHSGKTWRTYQNGDKTWTVEDPSQRSRKTVVGSLEEVRRTIEETAMARRQNPSPYGKPYGIIGDGNPIEYGGGIVYKESGSDRYRLIYFQPYDEDLVSVSDINIARDVAADLNWVDWKKVAQFIDMGLDELKQHSFSTDPLARADVYAAVGSYHGFIELDPDQQEMTIRQAERKFGRSVDAAHRAQSKRRSGNPSQSWFEEVEQPDRNPRAPLTKREKFFYDHAGYSYEAGSSKSKKKMAREINAIELAAAERWAEENGYKFEWEDDPVAYDHLGDVSPEDVSEVLVVLMKDPSGEVVQSLGGVLMGHNSINNRIVREVIEAELALEQIAEQQASRNPSRRRRGRKARKRNGAGLGGFVGSLVGSLVGAGVASAPVAYVGSIIGGAIGGYYGAQKDRKRRGTGGAALGAAVLGPVGSAIGGYVAGQKPDAEFRSRRSSNRTRRLVKRLTR